MKSIFRSTTDIRRAVLLVALAAAAGTAVGLVVADKLLLASGGVTEAQVGGDVEQGGGLLAPVDNPAPVDERSYGGFTVSFLGVERQGQQTTVRYVVHLASPGQYSMMLGDPRIINPDGSMVFPSSYAGEVETIDPDARGQQDGAQSVAIFDSDKVQPQAVVRFGPFLQGDAESVAFSATGAQLRAGLDVTIAGDAFHVTLEGLDPINGVGDVSMVILKNVEKPGDVELNYPDGPLTVTSDGELLTEVRGSAGFVKSLDFDINAGESTSIVAGAIADNAFVEVTAGSIARIVKGDWEFALE